MSLEGSEARGYPACIEAQVRTLEQVRQVRQVVAGTQALEFRRAEDDEGRYGWIVALGRRLPTALLADVDRAMAKPLSLLCLCRLRVNSTFSLSSILATRWLTYSLALSAWKPTILNGS